MVRYERTGAAAVVTIDRPERRNAVDGPTAAALLEAYERFAADDGARVHGADRRRRAGVLRGRRPQGARDARTPTPPAGRWASRGSTPVKPAIAAIGGWCVAGGLELALWCDLRIAREDARFGCLERRWGVPLIDGGTQRLPRVVGLGRALDLILTGRRSTPHEALAIGPRQRGRARRPRRPGARAGRGDRRLPAGDDALRPRGRARRARAAARTGWRSRPASAASGSRTALEGAPAV